MHFLWRKHCQTLGIAPGATKEELKSAYRKLVKIHHPDQNRTDPKAVQKFQELQIAYEFLNDNFYLYRPLEDKTEPTIKAHREFRTNTTESDKTTKENTSSVPPASNFRFNPRWFLPTSLFARVMIPASALFILVLMADVWESREQRRLVPVMDPLYISSPEGSKEPVATTAPLAENKNRAQTSILAEPLKSLRKDTDSWALLLPISAQDKSTPAYSEGGAVAQIDQIFQSKKQLSFVVVLDWNRIAKNRDSQETQKPLEVAFEEGKKIWTTVYGRAPASVELSTENAYALKMKLNRTQFHQVLDLPQVFTVQLDPNFSGSGT